MTDNAAKWKALTAPFKDDEIELLPKPFNKDAPKSKCAECGGYHGQPAVHLSYVGHAGLTMRLNETVGPDGWDWKPMALTEQGTPRMSDGGMWIKLTILGVTKIGFGDAQGKTGPNATKELIGDALRNAAMRFGIGTYLWSKSDKAKAELMRQGVDDDDSSAKPSTPAAPEAIGSDAPIIRAIHGKKRALGMTDAALRRSVYRDFSAGHHWSPPNPQTNDWPDLPDVIAPHLGDLTMTEAKQLADRMESAIVKQKARKQDADAEHPEMTTEQMLAEQFPDAEIVIGEDEIPF